MSSGYYGRGFVSGKWTVINFGANSLWGNYIVDFLCLEKRFIIEVDGGQHAEEKNHDAEWDAWLREQGFIILRFWKTMCLRISTE